MSKILAYDLKHKERVLFCNILQGCVFVLFKTDRICLFVPVVGQKILWECCQWVTTYTAILYFIQTHFLELGGFSFMQFFLKCTSFPSPFQPVPPPGVSGFLCFLMCLLPVNVLEKFWCHFFLWLFLKNWKPFLLLIAWSWLKIKVRFSLLQKYTFICLADISATIYYKSARSRWDGYMSINSPVGSKTTRGILCVYLGLGGFYNYSSLETRVRIMGHYSNLFGEPLCVNSFLGF